VIKMKICFGHYDILRLLAEFLSFIILMSK